MNDRRIEWAVALVSLGLTALTILLIVSPQIAPAIVSERLQLLINATATLAVASRQTRSERPGMVCAACVNERPSSGPP